MGRNRSPGFQAPTEPWTILPWVASHAQAQLGSLSLASFWLASHCLGCGFCQQENYPECF